MKNPPNNETTSFITPLIQDNTPSFAELCRKYPADTDIFKTKELKKAVRAWNKILSEDGLDEDEQSDNEDGSNLDAGLPDDIVEHKNNANDFVVDKQRFFDISGRANANAELAAQWSEHGDTITDPRERWLIERKIEGLSDRRISDAMKRRSDLEPIGKSQINDIIRRLTAKLEKLSGGNIATPGSVVGGHFGSVVRDELQIKQFCKMLGRELSEEERCLVGPHLFEMDDGTLEHFEIERYAFPFELMAGPDQNDYMQIIYEEFVNEQVQWANDPKEK